MAAISYYNSNIQVQSLDIEVDDDTYVGMPFVLFSGGRWMKDNGSDFYVEFGVESKEVQKVALYHFI